MNNLTIPEIEAIVCFFQDYINEKITHEAYTDNDENYNLSNAIEKLKQELR